ncbi:MAG: endonuclease dU [Candidatus Bathyarchaeales archaeon]
MPSGKFRAIKPEIRIVGVDDGVFVPRAKGWADVVGVVFRGGCWLDGIMKTEVTIDGTDATNKIAEMITTSPHYAQLRVIMLNGITFAGFNIVDIKKLFELTRLPVIAITREEPDFDDIREALTHLPESEKRWSIIKDSRQLIKIKTRHGQEPVYMQIAGLSRKDAEKIVKESSTRSNIPEPLRVAHIIASGLTKQKLKN